MKKLIIILLLILSCTEYTENTYQLNTPEWLWGEWINTTTQDVWNVEPHRIYRNGIEIIGYVSDGKDYNSDNGYYIEFPRENYFDNYYNGTEHDKVRFVFGNVHGRIESIYRVMNQGVEVYTDSVIYEYIRN